MQALIISNGIIEPAEPLNRSKFPPVQNSNELVAENFDFCATRNSNGTVQSPLFQFTHSNRKAASIKAAVKRLAFAYLRSQHEAAFIITIARVQSLSAALVLLQQRRNEQQQRRSAAGYALSPNLSGGRWPCADGTVRR